MLNVYAHHQVSPSFDERGRALHDRLGRLADEQRLLLDTALQALNALRVGDIGLTGATGSVLEDSLLKLRDLIDRSLPEARLASALVPPRAP